MLFKDTPRDIELEKDTEHIAEMYISEKANEVLTLKGEALIEGIDILSDILIRLNRETDPTLKAIDKTIKDSATYFLLPYVDTNNLAQSLYIHRIIQSLIKRVMIFDTYYDTEMESLNDKNINQLRANSEVLLKEVLINVEPSLQRVLRYGVAALFPYLEIEEQIKTQVSLNQEFTKQEIFSHLNQKSSDVPLLYAEVLAHYLYKFGPNVGQLLHYNQALLDLFDDIDDVAEDIQQGSNNVLIMACIGKRFSYNDIRNGICSLEDIYRESSETVLSIASDYEQWIAEISVAHHFSFLSELSQCYLKKVRKAIHNWKQ